MDVDPKEKMSAGEVSSGVDFERTENLQKQYLTAKDFSPSDRKNILEEAKLTAKKCRCEGPREMVRCQILNCRDCGHSVCEKCAGDPPHEFDRQDRARTMSPRDFEYKWSAYFHRAITLRWAEQIDRKVTQLVTDAEIFEEYRAHVLQSLEGLFAFHSFHREHHWTIEWKAPHAQLGLVLEQPFRWVLRIDPNPKWAGNSITRKIFSRLFARKESEDLDFDRLGEGWQIFVPNNVQCELRFAPSDETHASWRNDLGLIKYREETVPSLLQVQPQNDPSLGQEDAHQFSELSGTYHLRPNCGTAASCLYQKINDGKTSADGMCLFLDPHPIGVPELDTFVFSTNPLRIGFGETREIVGFLSKEWRPWGSKNAIGKATLECMGYWVDLGVVETTVSAVITEVAIAGPNHFATLSCKDCTDPDVFTILKVSSNLPRPFELVGSYQGITRSVQGYLKVFAYALTQQTEAFDHANEWQSLDDPNDAEHCDECAPPLPALEWTGEKSKVSCLVNVIDASDFERRMRSRPPVVNFSYSFADGANPTLTVGARIISLAHRAKASLRAAHPELSWKMDFKALDVPNIHITRFRLKDNKDNAAAPPPTGMKLRLRDDQLRSLHWMTEQESGRGVEFQRQEIEEAFIPELRVKLSVKASSPVHVRGGILADKPSYGKTACVIALIHQERLARLADGQGPAGSAPKAGPSSAGRSKDGDAPTMMLSDLKLDKGKAKAVDNPSQQSSATRRSADSRAFKVKATLICVSNEVAKQWKEEFAKFLSIPSRQGLSIHTVAAANDFKNCSPRHVSAADVVIVSWQALGAGYEKMLADWSEESMPLSNSTRHYREWLARAVTKLNASVAEGLTEDRSNSKAKGKGKAKSDYRQDARSDASLPMESSRH